MPQKLSTLKTPAASVIFNALGSTATTTPTAGSSTSKVLSQSGSWIDTNEGVTVQSNVTTSSATVDFTTEANTTIKIPFTAANTSTTINFTNLSSKATANKVFSFNVIVTKTTAWTTMTNITWQVGGVATPVKWSGGINPPVTLAANSTDIFTFFTIDGGTTLYGSLAMADVK